MECTVASDSESLYADLSVRHVDRSIENMESALCDLSASIYARVDHRETLCYSRNASESAASTRITEEQDSSEGDGGAPGTHSPVGGAAKRVFDVVAALAAITALLPMFAMVCIAVRLE